MEAQDTITIAPNVLITIAKHATEGVKGIAHMGQVPVDVGRLLRGRLMGTGVVLEIDDACVNVDLYVVMQPDADMRAVSRDVQQAVKRSITDLVGMDVTGVNVHIEDVESAAGDRA